MCGELIDVVCVCVCVRFLGCDAGRDADAFVSTTRRPCARVVDIGARALTLRDAALLLLLRTTYNTLHRPLHSFFNTPTFPCATPTTQPILPCSPIEVVVDVDTTTCAPAPLACSPVSDAAPTPSPSAASPATTPMTALTPALLMGGISPYEVPAALMDLAVAMGAEVRDPCIAVRLLCCPSLLFHVVNWYLLRSQLQFG